MKISNKIISSLANNKYYQYAYFLATFLLLFIITIYFYPIHKGHDLNFHLIRLDALAQALTDGSFPLYIDQLSIDGYGYAAKWFYSDFIMLPFAYLVQFIGVMSAYKTMIIVYTLLCAILSYISVYKVFKNRYIAFVFTILYTFSYYRLYDVYNRAALGETICLTFMPLVIWGAYEIIKGNYKKWYIISIAFALMLLAHVNTPVIVAFTTGIFFVIYYKSILKEPIRLLYLALAAIVSVLLSAYFVFPLLEQLISNEFYFSLTNERALSFPVQSGEPFKYIIRGLFSGITYVVPEIAGIGIVISFCVLLRLFITKNKLIKRADTYLIVGAICLFIVSPLYPWKIFPFSIIGFIQFSWRFYAVLSLILSVCGAVYFHEALPNDKRRFLAGIPVIFLFTVFVVSNTGQVFTNNRPLVTDFDRSKNAGYALMGAEYIPQKTPNIDTFFHQRANDSIRVINNTAQISNFNRELRTLSFDVKTSSESDFLELPLVYYKGYKATLNDKEIEVNQSENGLNELLIKESGHIKVFFGGTFIQNISPYITLIMSIMLIAYIIWFNRKEKND